MTSVLHRKHSDDIYTFMSHPRAVLQKKTSHSKKKHKDFDYDYFPMYENVMHDRRVYRGLTFPQPPFCESPTFSLPKQGPLKQHGSARVRKKCAHSFTPPPVNQLENVPIRTELYLEECSQPVEVYNCDTQTDTFIERPPTPPYIPAKTGLDAYTQIYEGELFDFDIEVVPILQILLEKITEQSLIEVKEEEELAYLRAEQNKFRELRNAELEEQRRLEEYERNLQKNKDSCLKMLLKALQIQKETKVKVTTLAFTQSYLADLIPVIYQNLVDTHYFFDAVEINIDHSFMPWLLSETLTHLNKVILYRSILDGIICEFVSKDDAYPFPLLALQLNAYRHDEVADSPVSELNLNFTAQEIEDHERKMEELRRLAEENLLLKERRVKGYSGSDEERRDINEEEEEKEEEEEMKNLASLLYAETETTDFGKD